MNRPGGPSRIPTPGTPLKSSRLSDSGPSSNPATPSPAKADYGHLAKLPTPTSSTRTPGSDRQERVKVVVRVRPALREDETDGAIVLDEGGQTLVVNRIDSIVSQSEFTFDTVLSPQATQHEVYTCGVKDVVEDVLKGYNGTVMAYGQTGAGKTFTIGNTDPGAIGMIPRCMAEIFKRAAEDTGNVYTVTMSYIQIYVEQIQDLLNPESDNLQIREDPSGAVHIPGVREQPVTNVEQCLHYLELGERNRTFAFTQMNAHSSRSHAVVMLTVTRRSRRMSDTEEEEMRKLQKDGVLPQRVKVGKLFLVDLAGSERLKKSKSTGTRQNEAIHINMSLTTLGMCINARANNERHVPFRDSKLTRLLQESLGGNAKTSLIVCVADVTQHAEETVQSLQFGTRAMNVKVKPVVNEMVDYQKLRDELKAEVDNERQRAAEEMVQSLYKQNIDEMQDNYRREKAQFQALIDALKGERDDEEKERLRLMAVKDKELLEKQAALEAHQRELEQQRQQQEHLASTIQEIQGEKALLERSAAKEQRLLAQQLREATELINNLKEQKATADDSHAKERQSLQTKLSEALARVADVQAEQRALEQASRTEVHGLQARITEATTSISQLQAKLSSTDAALAQERATSQARLAQGQADLSTLQQRMEEMDLHHAHTLQNAIQQHVAELSARDADQAAISTKLQSDMRQLRDLHAAEVDKLQEAMDSLREGHAQEMGSTRQAYETEAQEAAARHSSEVMRLTERLNMSEEAGRRAQGELAVLQANVADLRREKSESERRLAGMNAKDQQQHQTILLLQTKMTEMVTMTSMRSMNVESKCYEAMESKSRDLREIRRKVQKLQRRLEELQASRQQLLGSKQQLTEQVATLEQRLKASQAVVAEQKASIAELESNLAGSQAQGRELEASVQQLEAAKQQLTSRVKELEGTQASLEATQQQLEARQKELEASVASRDNDIDGLRDKVGILQTDVHSTMQQLVRARSTWAGALQQRTSARRRFEAALTIQRAYRRFRAAVMSSEIYKGERALKSAKRQLSNLNEEKEHLKLTQQQQLASWGAALIQDSCKRPLQEAVSSILREFVLPKRELDAHKRAQEVVGRMKSGQPASPNTPMASNNSFNRGTLMMGRGNLSRQTTRSTDM